MSKPSKQPSLVVVAKNSASLAKKQEEAARENPRKAFILFRWLSLRRNRSKTGHCDSRTNRKSKKVLSFITLAKERRFDEIVHILRQTTPSKNDNAEDARTAKAATEAWLQVSQNSFVSARESLHALCMYRPTVAAVQAVVGALKHINKNNVNATLIADSSGRTPLHVAVGSGCSLQVAELLMSGNTAVLTQDHARRYPLHWACANPHGLVNGGTNQKKATENMVQVINTLIEAYAVAVVSKDEQGNTPMDLAVAAKADSRVISALRFVTKIMPTGLISKDSADTEPTFVIPTFAVICGNDDNSDNDDDLSSVGSRGVSRHVRRYMSPKQKIPNLVFL